MCAQARKLDTVNGGITVSDLFFELQLDWRKYILPRGFEGYAANRVYLFRSAEDREAFMRRNPGFTNTRTIERRWHTSILEDMCAAGHVSIMPEELTQYIDVTRGESLNNN